MKKLILTLVGGLAALATMAQDLSPYTAFQIKKNVKVEILEVERVEKYGWDNLEIKYRLTNNSAFDLEKYDFMIHLVDKNGHAIGTINAYAFDIDKKTINEGKYIDTMSPYVNDVIAEYIPEGDNMTVIVEGSNEIMSIRKSQVSVSKL
ncbi:MAG: hypothetical protein OCD76_01880 [Reichenbachiella sp.]